MGAISACLEYSAPYVLAEINKFQVPVLLDSGSVFSVLSNDFVKLLGLTVQPSTLQCNSVTAQPITLLGSVKVNVKISHFSWPIVFLVAQDLVCPVILGVDFMIHSGMQLDMCKHQIWFAFNPAVKVPIEFDRGIDPQPRICASCDPLLNTEIMGPRKEKIVPDLSHLSNEWKVQITQLLEQFPDVLTSQLGLTKLMEYDIRLHDTTPVRLPPYRLSPPRMDVLKEKIDVMLEKGIIQHSRSTYSSPIFLVPKGDSDFRPVVDYRVLNTRIDVESVPLPDVHNSFHWFAKARYYTTIDLNSAYHQIPLSESSRQVTAFATDWNLYEYTRIPFGIAVGAQVLTRLLDSIFGDIKYKYLFHFLDDCVIYSETFDEHVQHLREVFLRLRKAGLTVNPDKVRFVTTSLRFLGHIISPSSVVIDPERTEKVLSFPPPKNVKQIARFVGMLNYFRKFIPDFAQLAAPLNKLRKKNVPFVWGDEQARCFDKLKMAITSPPVLSIPDFSKQFVLQTDACGTAVAAVLLQQHEDGRRPVAFASRSLTDQERKYSTYELEALAVLFGMEKFKFYLEHQEFRLETDNKALSWVLARPRKTGRVARWAVRISAFRFTVSHISGSLNCVADALSRIFTEDTDEQIDGREFSEQISEHESSEQQRTHNLIVASIFSDCPQAFSNLSCLQRQDPQLMPIIESLEKGLPYKPYSMCKNILCCNAKNNNPPKAVVPDVLVPAIFSYFHNSPVGAHFGVFKTRAKIREKFVWKGMDADIRARVRACEVCSRSKPAQNTHYGMLSSNVASRPMEKLFIDFVGRLPRSKKGNAYLFVVVDAFSKFAWFFPMREATTVSTMSALRVLIANFGVPQIIVSDNATQFSSRAFGNFCYDAGIKHVTTIPYYPNPSQAERLIRGLRSALIAYHSDCHSQWDEKLHWLQFAFNSARHESHNMTPFSLMMAYKPNCPLSNLWSLDDLIPEVLTPASIRDVWQRAFNNLRKSHARVKDYYDRRRKEVPFQVGDLVYCKNYPLSKASTKFAAKLAARYRGPFKILQFTSPVSVILQDGAKNIRAHVSQLKAGGNSD